MKNRIDKIVVLLFIITMCFLMSISAHAGSNSMCTYAPEGMPDDVVAYDTSDESDVASAQNTVLVWDFASMSSSGYKKNYWEIDGLIIYGSDIYGSTPYTNISNTAGLILVRTATTEYDHIIFTPEFDGELSVTYKSGNTGVNDRICAIGTGIVTGSDVNVLRSNDKVVACETADGEVLKTLQAKLKAGTTYYIYSAKDGLIISKIQYVAGAAPAVENDNIVTLTTTANMQGWRAFYDKENSYTVDDNTNVYIVVETEANETGIVKFSNRTGKKVPKLCPVVLSTNALQADGTYQITMTKDETAYTYDGNDNLLCASVVGTAVNAYRLGYKSGEDNGVAFYSWSADRPSDGVVYLNLPTNSGNAKIEFVVDENATGIVSVRDVCNESENVFNLNGQRLSVPRKGLNIVNGKKIIVR